jgi:hypothetical protein
MKRVTQKGNIPLRNAKYPIQSKMFDHMPYSVVGIFLVSNNVKMRPVTTPII